MDGAQALGHDRSPADAGLPEHLLVAGDATDDWYDGTAACCCLLPSAAVYGYSPCGSASLLVP